jgi:hypothetical protein
MARSFTVEFARKEWEKSRKTSIRWPISGLRSQPYSKQECCLLIKLLMKEIE